MTKDEALKAIDKIKKEIEMSREDKVVAELRAIRAELEALKAHRCHCHGHWGTYVSGNTSALSTGVTYTDNAILTAGTVSQ